MSHPALIRDEPGEGGDAHKRVHNHPARHEELWAGMAADRHGQTRHSYSDKKKQTQHTQTLTQTLHQKCLKEAQVTHFFTNVTEDTFV